jgi:uncharacterized protein
MTFDEMISAFRIATEEPPRAALAASGPHAAALAPEVYSRIDKLCRGIYLMPPDANLVLYGLYVLAASRQAELWPRLVDLARLKDGELEDMLPWHTDIRLGQLMLSVWDGDADRLFHLIEHADLAPEGRWALFNVTVRSTFDGRIARERTAAFLERFEAEALADDEDMVWWAWQGAIARLGLVALEPAMRRVWTKPVCEGSFQQQFDTLLDVLERAVAAPTDAGPLDEAGIRPVTEATEVADWLDEEALALAKFAAPDAGDGAPEDTDPARDIRLSPFELSWLDGFLSSRQVPPDTMSLEMLDGFVTALVIGPGLVPFTRHLGEIFATDDGEAIMWESIEQANFVLDLIRRLSNSISERRLADAPQAPLLDPDEPDIAGADWADGFLLAVDLGEEAWEPLWESPRGEAHLAAIEALIDGGAEGEPPLSRKERLQTLERLPVMLQRIAAFWRNPAAGFKGAAPVRVQKIGRNDPCPCGSGQKYKKCCALKPPPVTH